MTGPGEVTILLQKIGQGEPGAKDQLANLLYPELRRIASARVRAERNGQSLTPTALVHEAWLRFASFEEQLRNRAHFLAVAASSMRRVLIDRARSRQCIRRGAGMIRVDPIDIASPDCGDQLLALDDALRRLAAVSPRAAQVVEMRYFAGLTHDEIAAALGVDRRTVDRDWNLARTWLHRDLTGDSR